MEDYAGVLTEQEYADIQRLRRELSSGFLFLMFGESKAILAPTDTRYSGRVSEEALEARIAGVDARVPWEAVTGYAASSAVLLLLIGQVCLPIAKSFFTGDEQWQVACATLAEKVPRVPSGRRPNAHAATQWRTIVLWLALLLVIFLAWHFAQIPSAR